MLTFHVSSHDLLKRNQSRFFVLQAAFCLIVSMSTARIKDFDWKQGLTGFFMIGVAVFMAYFGPQAFLYK